MCIYVYTDEIQSMRSKGISTGWRRLTLLVIFRKSNLYLVALLWKMICNVGDPMSLRHTVRVYTCMCVYICMYMRPRVSLACGKKNRIQQIQKNHTSTVQLQLQGQHTALHCNTLQRTAAHNNTLPPCLNKIYPNFIGLFVRKET